MYRLILAALICAIVPLQAGVLWYQAPDTGPVAHVDQEFPDFVGYNTYQVHDVTVGAGGWIIQSITGYFGGGIGGWPTTTANVTVNIFPKSGSLPGAGDDPSLGVVHSASFSWDGTTYTVTVGGLSIPLAAGDWWIGLTPILQYSTYGQQFHWRSTPYVGDYTALRNPGGSFGFGTNWVTYAALGTYPAGDGAILIEGTGGAIPEPATWSLLALGVGALAFFRRRK